MKVIGSMEELEQFVDRPLYIRWSRLGPKERPYSLRHGKDAEPGLSVMPIGPEDFAEGRWWVAKVIADYGFLRHAGAKCWLVEGEEIGVGGDNEPVIRPTKYVAVLDEEFERLICEFAGTRAKAEARLREAPFGVEVPLPYWDEWCEA